MGAAGGRGDPEEVRARFVVDATGRDAVLGTRRVGKQRIPGLDQSALFTHWEGVWRETGRDEGNVQIVLFAHGWFWFIPFRGTRSSVGCCVSGSYMRTKGRDETLESFYDRTVRESCWATEWLARGERVAPVGATGDFSYSVDSLRGDGFVLVGDASGFIDPIFSTGIHLGVKGADLAADAIDRALRENDVGSERFAEWEATVRQAANLFMGLVRSFYAGRFRDTLFAPDQRKVLRKVITSLLAGDVFGDRTWHRTVRQGLDTFLSASGG